MSTARIMSLEVASEAAYGSPDANGIPSVSGLTFYATEFELGSVSTIGGEFELQEDATAHVEFGRLPPEVAASFDPTGARIPRQVGSVAVTLPVRGFGAGNGGVIPDANSMPLIMMLGSGGLDVVDRGGAGVTPSGMGVNNGICHFAADSGLVEGEVVLAIVNGCVVANRVTLNDSPAANHPVTFLHRWPADMTGIRIQRGMTLSVRRVVQTGTSGPSVAMRVRVLGAEMAAFGCRLEEATFSCDATGLLKAALTMRAAFIRTDINTTPGSIFPSSAARLRSPHCILRGAALTCTDGGTGPTDLPTVPVSLASTERAFELDGFSVTLTNTLAPIGTGCGAVGEADCEVADTVVTMTYTSRTVSDFDEADVVNRVSRGWTVAAAPVLHNANWLNGWACNIPAGYLTQVANVEAGGELLSQTRTIQAGAYNGDSPGTTNNAAFFIGGT